MTDSGLGGLSICAALQERLRGPRCERLTYLNAWPSESKGYNDFPTLSERAAVFDRALSGVARLAPDRILIACNTLSILYPHTAFSRATTIPVQGIIDTGVDLFAEAMAALHASSLLLLGTKTTIESGTHRDALLHRGIAPSRIQAIPCHGLARAIEEDPGGPLVTELVAACVHAAQEAPLPGAPLLVGLCCTHYAYIGDRIRTALAETLAKPVLLLDPNARMASALAPDLGGDGPHPSVQVLSKVELGQIPRRSIARLLEPVSPATAQALLSYRHVPDLF